MYSDFFYNYLNTGLPWIVIAIGYAVSDYLYNLSMCSILGGITQIKKYYTNLKNQAKTIFDKAHLIEIRKNYKIGSQKLLKEFYKDTLSWSWPITTLAIPTLIYGISRKLTTDGLLSLTKNNINVNAFFLLPNNEQVQFFFWGTALIISLRTFYRYQKERSKPTWFSKIWLFGFSRVLLFDFPLAYMVLSTIYVWLQYSTSIFQILSSDQLQYTIFHPDLMYGLGKIYSTVITMGVSLIILSLLPSLMLIREKGQKYNKMYYFLVYSGIIALFLLLSFLVIKFDQRIETIQEVALTAIQKNMQNNFYFDIKTVANLEYFSLISKLPRGFPVPAWVSFLLSARSIALFFEVLRIISPKASKSNLIKLLQKILGDKS
jgi:hypothetical protein